MGNRTGVLARLLTVIALGLVGCFGTTFTIGPTPVPTITSLSPSSVIAGSAAFDLTINGSGFGSWSGVRFGSIAYDWREFSSPTPNAIVIRIAAPFVATASGRVVTVNNRPAPTTGGGGTATANFTINNRVPSVASVVTNLPPPNDQNSVPAGGPAFRMMVTGSGFVAGSLVRWDGIARVTNVLSPNQVTTDVPASDSAVSRTVEVSVFNPAPGGGVSPTSVPFTFHYVLTLIPCDACIGILPWFQTRVTFDDPRPLSTETPLNGLYPRPPSNLSPRLNFGTGQWDWAAEVINGIPVNDAFFSAALPVDRRSFSFANGPRVLSSIEVITKAAGTLTLRDDTGRTVTQQITVGPVQTVATGWSSQPSAAITVEFPPGRALGITAITYLGTP